MYQQYLTNLEKNINTEKSFFFIMANIQKRCPLCKSSICGHSIVQVLCPTITRVWSANRFVYATK